MHSLRRLSASWNGSSPALAEVGHRHRLPGHEKNYAALPLGGNRPIATTEVAHVTATSSRKELEDAVRDQRRQQRRHHRHHHRSPSRSGHRSSKSRSSTSLESNSRSSQTSSTPSVKSRDSVTGHPDKGSSATGARIADGSPVLESPATTPPPSPHKHGSSMGIVISQGSKRRGTDGSETTTPAIMATPPTPSPLEQARWRNLHSLETPLSPAPPYPVTPPHSDAVTETSSGQTEYVAYVPIRASPTSPTIPSHPRAGFSTTAPAPVEIGSSDSIPQQRMARREDPYEMLQRFDTAIVIDDSGSMAANWEATRIALETVATVALKHDEDGIDIHFMNHPHRSAWNVKSASHIRRLFSTIEPAGVTPTGQCLDEIMRDYIDRYAASKAPVSPSSSPTSAPATHLVKVKPLNIVVLTDGEPTDDPESVIVSAARKLEQLNAPLHQVGIQFLQIGDEPGAREALEELDDTLADLYDIRDMVDTTRFVREGEQISGRLLLKALLGGVNRRWDRRGQ